MPFFTKRSKNNCRASTENLNAFQNTYDHEAQENLTALHAICKTPDAKLSAVREIIRFHPNLVDVRTSRCGHTPLHFAVANGDKKLVKYLLKKGPHVAKIQSNECSEFGYCVTPLHVAVSNEVSFDFICSIIRACPESVSVADGNGNVPHVLAMEKYTDKKVLSLLAPCSAAKKKEQLEKFHSSADLSTDTSLAASTVSMLSVEHDVIVMY